MIIENQTPDIQVLGNIQEFKTSIDPRNLEFITTLLSSNLYSNPEGSFLREIISNAWDSHIEAGNTAEPIIVKVDAHLDRESSITVRDYGTGLSPERFQTIFCNIGSSTKRESNDYTGGFGIGRFSCLACSDVVYITSYYEGKKYDYVMSKSGNTIVTHLLLTSNTKEKNGVSVTISGLSYILRYLHELCNLVFFRNVYVSLDISDEVHGKWEYNKEVKSFNEANVRYYTNFAVSDYDPVNYNYKVLLGNVLYKLDETKLCQESQTKVEQILQSGIFPKFNIGELEITPNREALIYTSTTIKKLEQRIDAVYEEIKALILSQDCDACDCKNTYEVYMKSNYVSYVLKLMTDCTVVQEKSGLCGNVEFYYPNLFDMTLNGKTITDVELREINSFWRDNFNGLVVARRLGSCWSTAPLYNEWTSLCNTKILVLEKGESFTPLMKSFLIEEYGDCKEPLAVFKHVADSQLVDRMRNGMTEYSPDIEKLILEDFKNRSTVISRSSDAFKAYRQRRSEECKNNEGIPKEKKIYLTKLGLTQPKIAFNSLSELKAYMKKLHKGCILCTTSEANDEFIFMACILKYEVLGVTKQVFQKLDMNEFSNFHTKEWFYDCKELKRLKAICSMDIDSIDHYRRVLESLPKTLQARFTPLYSMFKRVANTSAWYFCKKSSLIKEDPIWSEDCALFHSYMEKFKKAYDDTLQQDLTSPTGRMLVYAYIIKTKAYRVNYETYKAYKSNYLTKVLCGK